MLCNHVLCGTQTYMLSCWQPQSGTRRALSVARRGTQPRATPLPTRGIPTPAVPAWKNKLTITNDW